MAVPTVPEAAATKRGEGRVVHFYADEYEIKTQGQAADVVEITAHAGCEPPMHVHEREDESFYVLEGSVAFYAGDAVINGQVGTYVHLPRGVAHTFAIQSGTARMLVTTTPSGFLEMLDAVQQAFGGEMPATPAPEHGPVLGAILAEFGISIVGPNPGAA